ncbi:hypothetical protein JKP88DRAFT_251954 [Tribonema minus]|uniref:Uncharacterized protein n=1 Tax=Tribonema minus TaxID=303371 RepID=A0A835ZES1_9STRA|nr:hypothetical protein JKP88DRAFT_251954 [Tribonema minus]
MAKAAGSKTKYVAGGVAVAILAAAGIAIGVTLGVKNNKSSSSDSNLKGTSSSTAAAVLEKCGALEVYSKSQDNALDGVCTRLDAALQRPVKPNLHFTCATCVDVVQKALPLTARFLSTYCTCLRRTLCRNSDQLCLRSYDGVVLHRGVRLPICVRHDVQLQRRRRGHLRDAVLHQRPHPEGLQQLRLHLLPSRHLRRHPQDGEDHIRAHSGRILRVHWSGGRGGLQGVSTVSYKPAAETAEPTAAPTLKPTAKPTVAVVTVAPTALPTTPVPTKKPVVPAEDVCTQVIPPPGVKVGGCMQIMCIPQQVGAGDVFHVTSSVNLLDMTTKQYYTGSGTQPNQPYQCGEHTFQATFNANYKAGTTTYDIMWKWFVTPFWGSLDANTQYYDPFPNMLAESGINKQPTYGPLQGDCVPVPDRWWNLPPTGEQDGIDFVTIPQCIVKGKAWTIEVKVHLESALTADLRVNLQIGTGGDMYLAHPHVPPTDARKPHVLPSLSSVYHQLTHATLRVTHRTAGDKDIYVTESNKYGILPNPAVVSWDAPLPANYWTTYQMDFDADQMNLFDNGARLYIAAFLVPHLAQFNATIAGGWNVLDREYFLGLKFCNTLNEMAPAGAN